MNYSMNHTEQVIDVSRCFPLAIKAERKGVNTLILWKLDKSRIRLDGKRAMYELEYRWHRHISSHVTHVLGNEFLLWQAKEINLKKGLFEQFRLF
jgi:hypothetical protein